MLYSFYPTYSYFNSHYVKWALLASQFWDGKCVTHKNLIDNKVTFNVSLRGEQLVNKWYKDNWFKKSISTFT